MLEVVHGDFAIYLVRGTTMIFSAKRTFLSIFLSTLFIVSFNEAKADDPTNCATSPIETVDERYHGKTLDYNRDRVALKYGEFAAASSDAYDSPSWTENNDKRGFHLADDDSAIRKNSSKFGSTGWLRLPISADGLNNFNNLGGLAFNTYYQVRGPGLIVLVAYRGTEASILDWIANASWLTQWVNPYDQYRAARNSFSLVVDAAKSKANGRPITYVTTGHSLGGGLALHIAHRFDCVSAVVFNASFVTNDVIFGRYDPITIRIYEDFDILSETARFFKSGSNNPRHADYRMAVRPPSEAQKGIIYQHSMESLAAGMLRYAISCPLQSSYRCKFPASETLKSKNLYCLRYIKLRRPQNPSLRDDVCGKDF